MASVWGSDPTSARALFCQPEPGVQLLEDALWRGGESSESQTLVLVEGRDVKISMQMTMQITQSLCSLTWRPRRRLGESEGLSGAISMQWEAPGMRRADTEGPKAWVTLSTCQGSASPEKKGENVVLNRGEVET